MTAIYLVEDSSKPVVTMEERINVLFDRMTDSYRAWCNGALAWHAQNNGPYTQANADQDVANYRASLGYTMGKQYIRIIRKDARNHQCEGFIVATSHHKKFKLGDMLKANGWRAPALNFSRGNIFEETYTVRWTGIG